MMLKDVNYCFINIQKTSRRAAYAQKAHFIIILDKYFNRY